MRKVIIVLMSLVFCCAYSCHAQNGPTQPNVALTWTQSTTTGVTKNCVYRGTSNAGSYVTPALFCSTVPIVSYTDSTVTASTTYHYAVTASVGTTESAFSNDVTAVVPASPNAPTLNTPTETGKLNKNSATLVARVIWK